MRLTALQVENFRQFERASLTFAPGFTVIKGPNEAGKSTIQAAILTALFLDPQVPGEVVSDLIRWGQDERFRLRLEFEHDGARYLLAKDFQARSLSLQWYQAAGASGGSTAEWQSVQTLIGRALGTVSMEAFVNTACIRSEDLSKAPSASASVSHRLQAKVTGGRRADAAEVIQIMEDELLALVSGGPRRLHETGALRISRERLEGLRRNRSAVAAKLKHYQESRRLLARLRLELAGLEQAVAARAAQLEMSDRAQTLAEDCALLEEHLNDLQRADLIHTSIGRVADYLGQLDFRAVSGAVERAQLLDRQRAELLVRQADLNREIAVAMLTQLQQQRPGRRAVLLLCGAALAGACAAIAIARHLPAVAVGMLPALALIAAALLRRSEPPADIRPLNAELRLCTEKIRAAELELARLLGQYKVDSVDELATVSRELRRSGDVGSVREQRIAQILGSHRAENLQLAIERTSDEIGHRLAELAEVADRRLPADQYEQIDHELVELRAQRDQAQRELYRLEGELRANDVDSETLAALDEELQVEQIRLARLERRRKVLEYGISGMREALAGTLAQASTVFRAGIARHLGPITDGRYADVDAQITQDALNILVYTADRRRAVKADSLSRATQDQIYLAARLALLELACDGGQPPLIFDDPFVNYDDTRLENTMRLLRRLYGGYQIVLFTCTDRYDRYADQVIALDRPNLPDEQVPSRMAAS
jgi:uncharacterized protein YhaN